MKKQADGGKHYRPNNQSEQDKLKNCFSALGKCFLERLPNNKGNVVHRNPEYNYGATDDECVCQWKNILKENNFEELEKIWGKRAQERSVRKRAVERSNAIQNAYFTTGGIYNQLNRLSENFEIAEATGKALSIGVVYTILLELDHDLEKLAGKIEKMDQLGEIEPEFSRQEQQILNLEKSIKLRMRMLRLNRLLPSELNNLKADMDELRSELEEQKNREWCLPDFPEGQQSEEMWKVLQELAKEVDIDALGNDVESEESQARIRRQAEAVRQLSETYILSRWNKYPEQSSVAEIDQTISEDSSKIPDKTAEMLEVLVKNTKKPLEATGDSPDN